MQASMCTDLRLSLALNSGESCLSLPLLTPKLLLGLAAINPDTVARTLTLLAKDLPGTNSSHMSFELDSMPYLPRVCFSAATSHHPAIWYPTQQHSRVRAAGVSLHDSPGFTLSYCLLP